MLWVGLGNPGPDYRLNRHNIGFMAVERIASEYGFSQWRTKGGLCISEGRIGSQKIIALKPQSFMNKSGLPVAETARYYKISPADITVFHDEIDLGIARVRVKQGGGHGGHNGLRDIDRHLPQDYWRVRLGVGRPEHKSDVHKWVLQDFAKAEQSGWLDSLLTAMTPEAGLLASRDTNSFMSRVAYLAPAPAATTENND